MYVAPWTPFKAIPLMDDSIDARPRSMPSGPIARVPLAIVKYAMITQGHFGFDFQ